MLFKEYLGARKSVREYELKAIKEDEINELKEVARLLNEDESVKIKYFDDGKTIREALKGKAGYSGVMIESPHYLALEIKDFNEQTLIKGSYRMEATIKKAYELGLGTCWIDLDNVSDEILKDLFKEEIKPNYLVAIGYPKEKSILEKGLFKFMTTNKDFKNDPYANKIVKKGDTSGARIHLEDLVYKDSFATKMSIEEIEQRGFEEIFYLVRNAPSSKNSQPWRFVVEGSDIYLAILEPENKINFIDAGIMMYFFEGIAHDVGIKGKWHVIESIESNSYKDINYSYVAKFQF
ncbi:nitroreductase family protein [Peptostreptococcaceae bacterium AGR-M142]